MEHYTGIDAPLELSSVCIVDAKGNIVREAKVASNPDALVVFFKQRGLSVVRIGLEAGPLSQLRGASFGDAACKGGAVGDDDQDRPQGRTRHRATDPNGLVPARFIASRPDRKRCLRFHP
jgi:hypothetical protein